ncbi:MAG: DUF4381 domain-containing protein [Rhizobiaceae bacterium]|nr:DUF4381 domain-containing protein [Rhizobiaceae bacterium]
MEPQAPQIDPLTAMALRSLKDIATPEPVPWTPQTWGWALVAAIIAIALAIALLMWIKRYHAAAYRREAIAQLPAIGAKIHDPLTRLDGIHDLSALLKRVALAEYSRDHVASLSGPDWAKFLNDHSIGGIEPVLYHLLDDAEYRYPNGTDRPLPDDMADPVDAARKWIERHHVSA